MRKIHDSSVSPTVSVMASSRRPRLRPAPRSLVKTISPPASSGYTDRYSPSAGPGNGLLSPSRSVITLYVVSPAVNSSMPAAYMSQGSRWLGRLRTVPVTIAAVLVRPMAPHV